MKTSVETNEAPIETVSGDVVERIDTKALATVVRAEIDVCVTTAKAYPRSVTTFLNNASADVAMNEDVAASCFFSLPPRRGGDGKRIEGASIRLSEIMMSRWGNVMCEARIIDEGERFVTAQAVGWDMETNLRVSDTVSRRITTKDGRRFGDDMIQVTMQAAKSIALRNVISRVIPRAYQNDLLALARRVAAGSAETLADRRKSMVAHFAKLGVNEARVCAAVEAKGLDDIDGDRIATLKGIAQAIRDGDTTVDEAFPPVAKVAAPEATAPTTNVKAATAPKSAPTAAEVVTIDDLKAHIMGARRGFSPQRAVSMLSAWCKQHEKLETIGELPDERVPGFIRKVLAGLDAEDAKAT